MKSHLVQRTLHKAGAQSATTQYTGSRTIPQATPMSTHPTVNPWASELHGYSYANPSPHQSHLARPALRAETDGYANGTMYLLSSGRATRTTKYCGRVAHSPRLRSSRKKSQDESPLWSRHSTGLTGQGKRLATTTTNKCPPLPRTGDPSS
jgi:hypothetical protein